MLLPLTPLGDFVTKVGKPPDKEALTTYFARLREHVRSHPPIASKLL